MSSWRALCNACLSALFSNAEQNRIIVAVAVRRPRAWYGRRYRSLTRSIRFAIPPRRAWSPLRAATVESYCTPRQSRSVLTVTKRHDANAGFPRQHIRYHDCFPCCSFISLGVVQVAVVPYPYRRKIYTIERPYWVFCFGLLSRNRAGTQKKGGGRSEKRTTKYRPLISIIFPEPIER